MALELEVTFKGVSCNYWKITKDYQNFAEDTTRVELSLYESESARTASVTNTLDKRQFKFSGTGHTRAELYTKIKEPVYETIGEPPDQEQVQINPFVDAEDV